VSITCPSSANWSLPQSRARSRRSALTLASPTSPRSRPGRRSSTRFLQRAERRLRRLHRQLSRRRKGSSNREKARLLLARQYERVTRKRADFLHRLSHRLTSEYGLIRFEGLNVAGMLKNHLLAQGIADSGWSMFAQMCEYKAAQSDVRVFYVGPGTTAMRMPLSTCSTHRERLGRQRKTRDKRAAVVEPGSQRYRSSARTSGL